MRIFYGVQSTGNGHITRARIMGKALIAAGFKVDFLFTGRPIETYFEMEIFGNYQYRSGLTFNSNNGKINYLKTLFENKHLQFLMDINQLDLSNYDLVISDFEPVTSWAAKRQNKKLIGIGHQYAFNYKIPLKGFNPISNIVMKNFAPVDIAIGLHWYHFNQPILPPIIEILTPSKIIQTDKILVYLPFEDQNMVSNMLCPFDKFQFYIYSPQPITSKYSHIYFFPLSLNKFKQDLYDCVGIISNAGFELPSEALQLGKKILVKPLHRQMEQISNAATLKKLGYGDVMYELDSKYVQLWLNKQDTTRIIYPNIANTLTQWINEGMPTMDEKFIETIWHDCLVQKRIRR